MTNSDMPRRGPPPDLRNNKIMIRLVLGLVVGGVILYGLDSFVFHPTPPVHVSAPTSEPTGEGPGTPGRL